VKNILISCHLGPKMGHYFVRYKREFVITVIVITEFDCKRNLIEKFKTTNKKLKIFTDSSRLSMKTSIVMVQVKNRVVFNSSHFLRFL